MRDKIEGFPKVNQNKIAFIHGAPCAKCVPHCFLDVAAFDEPGLV